MGAPTDLYDAAVQLLEACRVALDTLPAQAPETRYVYPGASPALECDADALIVNVPTITTMASGQVTTPGDAGRDTKKRINLPVIGIIITRCYAADAGLNIESYDDAARKVLSDIWCLWNLLPKAKEAGTLGALFGECAEVFFDPPAALEPQGGTVGWTMTVRPWLPGYANPGDA